MAMRSIEYMKVRKYFYTGSLLSIFILFVALSIVFIKGMEAEHQAKVTQLSESIINEKKNYLRNAVEQTIYMIEKESEELKEHNWNGDITKEQFSKLRQERIADLIREMRLIDNGYVWVNHIIDYNGGDDYAIRAVHPNLPETEGALLSTNATDIKGNRPYEEELEGIKKDGELYFEYYFKKLDSEKVSRKLSFAKLYEPFDWVVATGVYLDDVDDLIKREEALMQKSRNKHYSTALFFALMSTIIAGAVLMFFEKRIRKMIIDYETDINSYTNSLIKEKEKTEKALAEVKTLKGIIPICSYCKKIRNDKGAWDLVEAYISRHSDASFSHGMCPECEKAAYDELDES